MASESKEKGRLATAVSQGFKPVQKVHSMGVPKIGIPCIDNFKEVRNEQK
jgi:hypothetical protein